MLVTTKEIMERAYKEHYAVISPSIDGPDCIWMAIKAAEEKKSPVILGMRYEPFQDMKELKVFVDLARKMAQDASVPVSINFDHCHNMEEAMSGLYAGVTSVMLDYSLKSFEENVKGIKELCDLCHPLGIPVEAELGHLGVDTAIPGKENDAAFAISESIYTDPQEAAEFVRLTNVDCLAVSIGNKHGIYANDIIPHIDFDVLEKLNKACGIPLVLHGGSGTGDENLRKAGTMGICKINVGADVRKAAADAVIEADRIQQRNKGFFLSREGYLEKVKYYMDVFGSSGKAW